MRIAIAGAGAMGSRFGLMLQQGGNEVLLIDGWAEHVQQIQEHGLRANYNGKEVVAHLPILLQSEVGETDQVDLIILFYESDAVGKNVERHSIVDQRRYGSIVFAEWYRSRRYHREVCSNGEYLYREYNVDSRLRRSRPSKIIW